MADEFTYDVFLSHSARDKPVVRDVAERLRKDGVWNDAQLSTLNSHLSTVGRLRLGAVGGGHVPLSRSAEQGAPCRLSAPGKGELLCLLTRLRFLHFLLTLRSGLAIGGVT